MRETSWVFFPCQLPPSESYWGRHCLCIVILLCVGTEEVVNNVLTHITVAFMAMLIAPLLADCRLRKVNQYSGLTSITIVTFLSCARN